MLGRDRGIDRDGPRTGEWFAVGAALLSLLLPGLGQLACGRRMRGLVMLAVSLGLVVAGLALWQRGSVALLALLVRPSVLILLLVLDAALLAFRTYAVLDAYRIARAPVLGEGRRHWGTAVALAVLLLLTAAPHVAAGYYDVLTLELLSDVFAAQEGGADTPAAPAANEEFQLTLPVVPTVPAGLEPTPAA